MPLDPAFLATAIDAAQAGGRIAKSFFRKNPAVHLKGRVDLVTEADIAVEQDIRARIARRFPDHTFLGEESGLSAVSGRYRWIVDPIDGTTNFAHGLALFCVSVALEVDGQVVVGAIYDPMAEELFTAERNHGARCNGERIHVSRNDLLVNSLLVTGFPPQSEDHRDTQIEVFAGLLARARAVRRLGSAALDLCYVAAGRFDGFWEQSLHAWDVAAGALLVEEAGGTVTDFAGDTFSPFCREIIASNGLVHGQIRDVVTALGK